MDPMGWFPIQKKPFQSYDVSSSQESDRSNINLVGGFKHLKIKTTNQYPLVNIQKAMENGPVEIVDFPIKNKVDLSMAKWDSSPEGIIH